MSEASLNNQKLTFPPTDARSAIRFQQNGCLSCSQLGLGLGKQDMVDARLIRCPGGDLGATV
jgi:hypothetical protein